MADVMEVEDVYREIFGDDDSDEEDFYGFQLSSDEEEDQFDDTVDAIDEAIVGNFDQDADVGGQANEHNQASGEPQRIADIDPAEEANQHAWLKEFTEETGLKFDPGEEPREIEFFSAVFNDYIFALMTLETNCSAGTEIERLRRLGRVKATSRGSKWTDVDMSEMKAFVGIVLLMGYAHLPSYDLYWSNSFLVQIPGFRKTLSRDRFLAILTFFI